MAVHDWTRLEPGDFHHFHQGWVVNLTNSDDYLTRTSFMMRPETFQSWI